MFNHLEYDTLTLAEEYARDGARQLPAHYFPGDDPARTPQNHWRSHAHLLFGNWIDEMYQTAPFDLDAVGQAARSEEHTSELQSLMRTSSAVLCLQKQNKKTNQV